MAHLQWLHQTKPCRECDVEVQDVVSETSGRAEAIYATMRPCKTQGKKDCQDSRKSSTMVIKTRSHSRTWPSPSRSFMYW